MPNPETPAGPDAPAATADLEATGAPRPDGWIAGDFGPVGVHLQVVGESLCEAVDLLPGERVLDVGAGSGSASLAAARRFAEVTSTDDAPSLLDQGRRRAKAEGLAVQFEAADAEALPFPDGAFDVGLSMFGVMFASDPAQVARELLRVVRPGGRIGLCSWTPEGFFGALFRTMSAFVWPPAGLALPLAWGSEGRLRELFATAAGLRPTRKTHAFRFRSAEHWVDFFRASYGPTHRVFASLGVPGQRALRAALVTLLHERSVHRGGALVVPAEYLEAVVSP